MRRCRRVHATDMLRKSVCFSYYPSRQPPAQLRENHPTHSLSHLVHFFPFYVFLQDYFSIFYWAAVDEHGSSEEAIAQLMAPHYDGLYVCFLNFQTREGGRGFPYLNILIKVGCLFHSSTIHASCKSCSSICWPLFVEIMKQLSIIQFYVHR